MIKGGDTLYKNRKVSSMVEEIKSQSIWRTRCEANVFRVFCVILTSRTQTGVGRVD